MSNSFDILEVDELLNRSKTEMAKERAAFDELNGLQLQNPFGGSLVSDLENAVSEAYQNVLKLSKIYLLEPSTLLLFDSYFVAYLGHCLTKLVKPWIRSSKRIVGAIDLFQTDALICLRVAMKMNENQDRLCETSIQSLVKADCDCKSLESAYQSMLNRIILHYIKANPGVIEQGLSKQALEDKILTYINQTECNLLETLTFNLRPYNT